MGGCFLHRQEIPPQEKQLLTHHALKKTFKHLHGAASSTLAAKDTGCCRVADLFYTDTLFVPISSTDNKDKNLDRKDKDLFRA